MARVAKSVQPSVQPSVEETVTPSVQPSVEETVTPSVQTSVEETVTETLQQTVIEKDSRIVRRLSDEERGEIIRLNNQRVSLKDIAAKIGTTYATVARIVRADGGESQKSVTPALSDIQKRLITYATTILAGNQPRSEEHDELKAIVMEKIKKAQEEAIARALESI